jgi:hypothetical protein
VFAASVVPAAVSMADEDMADVSVALKSNDAAAAAAGGCGAARSGDH